MAAPNSCCLVARRQVKQISGIHAKSPVKVFRDAGLFSTFRQVRAEDEVVHSRNPADGGAEERRMAQRYERDAATLRGRWSRTASILRELAKTYRLQAQREDNQSELLGQLDA